MREREKGILTYQGRVVYDRKKRLVKCTDVFRFAKAAQLPEDFEQLEKLLYTIITLLGILYSVRDNVVADNKSKLYRLVTQIESYSKDIREIWDKIGFWGAGGSFGGGGATGDF